ncbi:MAG: hypothetical protein ACLPYB_12495 [Desulfobaccales bacterium]
MKRGIGVMVLVGLLGCQGCAAAAIGYMGYKLSQARTESAEKAERAADLRTYTDYRVRLAQVNLERERSGLKPTAIMSQEDWIGAQTAGRPAIAPAK